MTTQILSDTLLKNPLPDTPFLPDLSTGFMLSFKSDDIGVSNGSAVDNWIASGPGNINMRTLNSTTSSPNDGSSMNFPTYGVGAGPGGHSAVVFDGTSRLATVGVNTIVNQPLTMAVVFKYDPDWLKLSARIIGGIVGAQSNIITPSGTSGQLLLNGGTQVSTGIRTADWLIAIVVFNGANSKWKFNDGNIVTGNTGSNPQRGMTIGASNGLLAAVDAPGAKMSLTELTFYNRALGNDDIIQLHQVLKTTYGL